MSTLQLLTVESNQTVTIYADGFPDGTGKPMPLTLHVRNHFTGEDETVFTVHALNGAVTGTDVDISLLPRGWYECYFTDSGGVESNRVPLIVPASNTPKQFPDES